MGMRLTRHRILVQLLTAVFLVLVQSQLFAHEIDHVTGSDGAMCAVCSVSGNLEHGLPLVDEMPPSVQCHSPYALRQISPPVASLHAVPEARGPPATL